MGRKKKTQEPPDTYDAAALFGANPAEVEKLERDRDIRQALSDALDPVRIRYRATVRRAKKVFDDEDDRLKEAHQLPSDHTALGLSGRAEDIAKPLAEDDTARIREVLKGVVTTIIEEWELDIQKPPSR